jgi:hypothetical protein
MILHQSLEAAYWQAFAEAMPGPTPDSSSKNFPDSVFCSDSIMLKNDDVLTHPKDSRKIPGWKQLHPLQYERISDDITGTGSLIPN